MLNFRKITLADRPWIQEALKQSDFMGFIDTLMLPPCLVPSY